MKHLIFFYFLLDGGAASPPTQISSSPHAFQPSATPMLDPAVAELSNPLPAADSNAKVGQTTESGTDGSPPGNAPKERGTGVSSNGGGGGPLSNGAIAGIALGVGLAIILLVAGLAWLLLRRRRQKRRDAARAAGRLASKTAVEDRDMHEAHVAESPRSPYSDAGPSLQSQNSPVSPLAPASPLALASHGKGVDVAALHRSHSDADAGAGAGEHDDHDDHDVHAQTQRDVPKTVAHLVEEGMTAEEIRRLEDEERQLDAEIERAARR